jgi:uncharacterized membrane protein
MKPENFTFVGFVMLILGFALAMLGGYWFSQVYFCTINYSSTCPLTSAEAATRIGYSIPFLLFGTLLIIPGAILTAAGHLSEHLRPAQGSEEESEAGPQEPKP